MTRITNFILLSFFILILASCGKDLSYDTLHERVIGTWYPSEVTFREKGSVINKDVTANWDRYKFVFYADESFELVNHQTEEVFDGYWYINEYWTNNNNESDKVQELIFVVYDSNYEQYREYILKDPSVTSSTLKGKRKANNGIYKFKLKK